MAARYAASVQERGVDGNSSLLAKLTGTGQLRTVHAAAPGDIGVTESSFEDF